MRSARLALVAAATTMAALVIGSAPAAAGGPTSVLVANPGSGTVGSLYVFDADYAALQEALEPADVSVDDAPALASGPGTSAINATWLVHDVVVWRVDRIRLDAGPHVWVQTTLTANDRVEFSSEAEWHIASDAATVYEVLGRLGVIPDDPAGKAAAKAGEAMAAGAVAEGGPASEANADGGTSGGASSSGDRAGALWWLVPGVAVGAILGAIGRPLAAESLTRRRHIVAPRQELIDM